MVYESCRLRHPQGSYLPRELSSMSSVPSSSGTSTYFHSPTLPIHSLLPFFLSFPSKVPSSLPFSLYITPFLEHLFQSTCFNPTNISPPFNSNRKDVQSSPEMDCPWAGQCSGPSPSHSQMELQLVLPSVLVTVLLAFLAVEMCRYANKKPHEMSKRRRHSK